MKFSLILLLAGTLIGATLVKREVLKPLEGSLRDTFQTHEMEILAYPSGVYVDGVGVVFTADVTLTYAPMPSPFQQTFPPEYKARVHNAEIKALPVLREEMRQFLLRSSAAIDSLPMNELIVAGVKVSHQLWEDKTGLPEQIVMQGTKSKLLDAKAGKIPVDSAIRVQEQ